MLKPLGYKEIFTILRLKIVFILTYAVCLETYTLSLDFDSTLQMRSCFTGDV